MRKIEDDPFIRFCPNKKCNAALQVESLKQKSIKCSFCGMKVCSKCKEEFLPGGACCQINA